LQQYRHIAAVRQCLLLRCFWNERFSEIAAELVWLKVDVIVTTGDAAVMAAKQATSVIPIVVPLMVDPVRTCVVASLARPGANVTGM
jgi:putative ABC transport system substrate-binding protein